MPEHSAKMHGPYGLNETSDLSLKFCPFVLVDLLLDCDCDKQNNKTQRQHKHYKRNPAGQRSS